MKQVVLRGGRARVVSVPAPSPAPGWPLVAVAASVISSGTERTALSVSGGSLPMRAIRNPALVRRTLEHARAQGLLETAATVRGVIASDTLLGYSCAGTVIDTGGVASLSVGQAVACAGAGHANHAELVSVPANLVAPVPEGVAPRDAAFCTLGAIALQGVRRARPELGERVVVVGLGLLGLLAVQLLRAAGCPVLGVEPQAARRTLAEQLGAERAVGPDEAAGAVDAWSGGVGADAVLIAAAGGSRAIVNSAVAMLRRKGRVVPLGAVALDLEREALYEREADVLISTSYGPGRYDPTYEEGGLDYPIAYVRWTENRNMEEFLRLLGAGRVTVDRLAELELPLERAPAAYAAVNGERAPLAVVLSYPSPVEHTPTAEIVRVSRGRVRRRGGRPVVAVIGAGAFVRGTHLPNLRADARARVKWVVARRGTTATEVARSLDGASAATDWRPALEDPEVDLVLVGTRHDTHAEIAAAALRAGKAVLVEKPLGLSRAEIDDVWAAGRDNDRLAIGFNRPFAPLAARMAAEVRAARGPVELVYRVSAPPARSHWLNDPAVGGGRIQGEACHMFDFANWLCGTPRRVFAAAPPLAGAEAAESAIVTIEYAGGSVACVHYSGAGPASMPKERIEVLRAGRSWVLDDFQALTAYDPGGERALGAGRPDKGHAALMAAVLEAARGERAFEPGLAAAYAAQSVALAALASIAGARAIEVELPGPAILGH